MREGPQRAMELHLKYNYDVNCSHSDKDDEDSVMRVQLLDFCL